MAYARAKFNQGAGSNLLAHAEAPTDVGKNVRASSTFNSSITFNAMQIPAQATHVNNRARDK